LTKPEQIPFVVEFDELPPLKGRNAVQ